MEPPPTHGSSAAPPSTARHLGEDASAGPRPEGKGRRGDAHHSIRELALQKDAKHGVPSEPVAHESPRRRVAAPIKEGQLYSAEPRQRRRQGRQADSSALQQATHRHHVCKPLYRGGARLCRLHHAHYVGHSCTTGGWGWVGGNSRSMMRQGGYRRRHAHAPCWHQTTHTQPLRPPLHTRVAAAVRGLHAELSIIVYRAGRHLVACDMVQQRGRRASTRRSGWVSKKQRGDVGS